MTTTEEVIDFTLTLVSDGFESAAERLMFGDSAAFYAIIGRIIRRDRARLTKTLAPILDDWRMKIEAEARKDQPPC